MRFSYVHSSCLQHLMIPTKTSSGVRRHDVNNPFISNASKAACHHLAIKHTATKQRNQARVARSSDVNSDKQLLL